MQWLIDLLLESLQGVIVMWSGAHVDIPTGWALCDGTQGTPDLSQRFVRSSGNGLIPGQVGGTLDHAHTFTGDGHVHPFIAGPGGWLDGLEQRDDRTGEDNATGLTDVASSLPVYYVVAFIMKV